MPRRGSNGRHRRRQPTNAVYRSIRAAGGTAVLEQALGVSLATLKRWRRLGRVLDPVALLAWAALVHPDDPARQLALAHQLAGVPTGRRRR